MNKFNYSLGFAKLRTIRRYSPETTFFLRLSSLDSSADTPPGRITQAEGGEQFSSLAEIRGGSRMERRLTEERGGVKREREDPDTERRG